MNTELYKEIKSLSDKYASELRTKIDERTEEMKSDDNSHFLIYRVLGISESEGNLIDIYQNKGRFVYKYAGAFLEEATVLCLKHKYPNGSKTRIPNTLGKRPSTYEIDFLNSKDALEIKWRDATTDGDHITKEHTRVKVICQKGYKPIRVMFYYPQREQAIRIQETLKTLYEGINGKYYAGNDAWDFIKEYTEFDLKEILEKIAGERTAEYDYY